MFCGKCGAEIQEGAKFCWECGCQQQVPIDSGNHSNCFFDVVSKGLSGQFDVVRELGRGGMAVVFEAVEKSLERRVALKVLPEKFTHDEDFSQRFLGEARLVSKLFHPNIVPIFSVGQTSGIIYFSMALLCGSLSEQIPGKVTDAVKVIKDVAAGLDYAHGKGLVHRDIKPDNIMFDENSRAIVTDFGIVKALDGTRLTKTGMTLGTPEYMSPEQVLADEIDGRADLYSLGVVFFRLLTGQLPFSGSSPTRILYRHVHEKPQAPFSINDEVPSDLNLINLKLLEKDPGNRFQTGKELIEALDYWLASKTQSTQNIGVNNGYETERENQSQPSTTPRTALFVELDSSPEMIGANDSDTVPQSESLASSERDSKTVHLPTQIGNIGNQEENEDQTYCDNSPRAEKTVFVARKPNDRDAGGVARPKIVLFFLSIVVVIAILFVGLVFFPGQEEQENKKAQSAEALPVVSREEMRQEPDVVEIPSQVETEADEVETLVSAVDQEDGTAVESYAGGTNSSAVKRAALLEEKQPHAENVGKKTTSQVAKNPTVGFFESLQMEFVWIEPGTFEMGNRAGSPDEKPAHQVSLTKGFFIQSTEVTQNQWQMVMESNPSLFKGDTLPVEQVSWHDVEKFIQRLNSRTDHVFRLPTEAEWEFVAKTGGHVEFSQSLDEIAWYKDNSSESTHAVGTKKPNLLGVFDMQGNVWEWCEDYFGDYKSSRENDPIGPNSGLYKVVRGGSWESVAWGCRPTVRGSTTPYSVSSGIGFRLVKELK